MVSTMSGHGDCQQVSDVGGCCGGDGGEVVRLNVGGVPYQATLFTLTSACPESMLSHMFAPHHQPLVAPSRQDQKGRYFIDRDGHMFRHVLNYLRNRKLVLPRDFQEYELLLAEAQFYQIYSLIQEVTEAKEAADQNARNTRILSDMEQGEQGKGRSKKPLSSALKKVKGAVTETITQVVMWTPGF